MLSRKGGECSAVLGCIYIRAKAKAMSLPTCCIVSYLCVYTIATAVATTKIKDKNRFRSNINAPLGPKFNTQTFGLVVECWTDVREVVGSKTRRRSQYIIIMIQESANPFLCCDKGYKGSVHILRYQK